MDVPDSSLNPPPAGSPGHELAGLLGPGVVSLDGQGGVRFADARALELLGCADGFELERLWEPLKGRLEAAGLSWNGAGGSGPASLELPVEGEAEPRSLLFDLRRDPASGGVLLVASLGTLAGLERDLNTAVMADSPDTAKIEQLKTAILEAQTAALNERVDLELRIAQILTPEQRQKAREMPAGPRGRGQRF